MYVRLKYMAHAAGNLLGPNHLPFPFGLCLHAYIHLWRGGLLPHAEDLIEKDGHKWLYFMRVDLIYRLDLPNIV